MALASSRGTDAGAGTSAAGLRCERGLNRRSASILVGSVARCLCWDGWATAAGYRADRRRAQHPAACNSSSKKKIGRPLAPSLLAHVQPVPPPKDYAAEGMFDRVIVNLRLGHLQISQTHSNIS